MTVPFPASLSRRAPPSMGVPAPEPDVRKRDDRRVPEPLDREALDMRTGHPAAKAMQPTLSFGVSTLRPTIGGRSAYKRNPECCQANRAPLDGLSNDRTAALRRRPRPRVNQIDARRASCTGRNISARFFISSVSHDRCAAASASGTSATVSNSAFW